MAEGYTLQACETELERVGSKVALGDKDKERLLKLVYYASNRYEQGRGEAMRPPDWEAFSLLDENNREVVGYEVNMVWRNTSPDTKRLRAFSLTYYPAAEAELRPIMKSRIDMEDDGTELRIKTHTTEPFLFNEPEDAASQIIEGVAWVAKINPDNYKQRGLEIERSDDGS